MLLVVAFCNKDAELAIANLEWQEELSAGQKSTHTCLLSYEESTARHFVDQAHAIASRVYASVEVFVYPDAPVRTWPQAPNYAWQSTARYIEYKFRQHWLWLEADAIPLKPGWLEAIDEEYRRCGKPLMGAVVKGVVPGNHVNGVAVYPWNVSYITTRALLCGNAAWDCVMAQETMHCRHECNRLIHHLWGVDKEGNASHNSGEPATFTELQQVYKWVNLDAVLCHRVKDASLIYWLRMMRSAEFNVPQLCPNQAKPEKPKAPAVNYPPVEIFIVSHQKDMPWLEYCLASVKKFCTGFGGVTLVVPEQERSLFKRFVEQYGVRLHGNDEPPGKGHLAHMWAECCADKFVPAGALAVPGQCVLHLDSDCIFKMPTTPLDFFHDGKPVYIIRTYESLYDPVRKVVSDCAQWQAVVERMLGWKPSQYTMCRMPTINDLRIFGPFREWIEATHNRPFREYWLDQRNDFPPSVTEYPAMGAFAFEFYPELYHWVHSEKEVAPVDRLYQFWSHGGITPQIKQQIEGWLA